MRLARLRLAAAVPAVASGLVSTHSYAEADALRSIEPKPPDRQTARTMIRRWTEQEESRNFHPPGNWPSQKSLHGDIPGLRSDLKRCGGDVQCPQCQHVAFRLGVALLGGALFGHTEDGDRDQAELAEGADIMRRLAENGSAEGARHYSACVCVPGLLRLTEPLPRMSTRCLRLGLLPRKRRGRA